MRMPLRHAPYLILFTRLDRYAARDAMPYYAYAAHIFATLATRDKDIFISLFAALFMLGFFFFFSVRLPFSALLSLLSYYFLRHASAAAVTLYVVMPLSLAPYADFHAMPLR